MSSRKILAQIDTADFRDCVATGYSFYLYADGHVAAEYRSRWQGSRDGARYVTDPGAVNLSAIDDGDPDKDAEAVLTEWVTDEDPATGCWWRQTRLGSIVR